MVNFFIVMLLTFTHLCFAEQGISDRQIKLGMSSALTGPASQLGQELRKGSKVYFDQLNKQGGIFNRKIKLISLDDGYEPQNTVDNTRQLIFNDQVFALFGYVGTPTSAAVLPLLKQLKIPYLMPFTGADFLRKPTVNNIFNLRASYLQEAKTQIEYLIKKQHLSRFAFIIQADEFGLAAQRSYIKILQQYNLKPIVNERFKRNTNDIETVLAHLPKKKIDAVIFVGTYEPFSYLINLSGEQNFNPIFASLSFVSSQDVFSRLKHPSKVVISEVMPDPLMCSWKICRQFIKAMKEAGYQRLNRLQLEGYLNAHIFTLVARKCGQALTRACLLEQFEHFQLQENNLKIDYSPTEHQGLNQVYLSFSKMLKDN